MILPLNFLGVIWVCYLVILADYLSPSKMASNHWNQETKARLSEKISANINDLASLTRQITKGSKSNEVCTHLVKKFLGFIFASLILFMLVSAVRKSDVNKSFLYFSLTTPTIT